MSRSMSMLKVLAPAAASVPPTTVSTTRAADGTPRAATNMGGTVVTKSSSMMRGLVSATNPRSVGRNVAGIAVRLRVPSSVSA